MENQELIEELEYCSRLLLEEDYKELVDYINKSKFKTELIAEFEDEYEESIDEINTEPKTDDLKIFKSCVNEVDKFLSIDKNAIETKLYISKLKDCLLKIRRIKRYIKELEYYSFTVNKEVKEMCDRHNFKDFDELEKYISELIIKYAKDKKVAEKVI